VKKWRTGLAIFLIPEMKVWEMKGAPHEWGGTEKEGQEGCQRCKPRMTNKPGKLRHTGRDANRLKSPPQQKKKKRKTKSKPKQKRSAGTFRAPSKKLGGVTREGKRYREKRE